MSFYDYPTERRALIDMDAQGIMREIKQARMPINYDSFKTSIGRIMDGEYDVCEDCGGDGCIPHDCGGGCRDCHQWGVIKCGSCEGTGYAKARRIHECD